MKKPIWKNTYSHNLDNFKSAQNEMLLYSEEKQILLDLRDLYGIASGPDNMFFVTGDRYVVVFHIDRGEQQRIKLPQSAICIAYSSDNLLYLGMEDHIEIYMIDGRRKDIWASLGNQAIITSVAVIKDNVFVSDAGNKLIHHFNNKGKLIKSIGKRGNMKRSFFLIPSPYFDIVALEDNIIWVTNPGHHRVEKRTFSGDLLSTWGYRSIKTKGFSGCCNPIHITLLPDGSIVTSEKGLPRVKVYSTIGQLIGVVATPELFDFGTSNLDLSANEEGDVYILDPKKRSVRIFRKIMEKENGNIKGIDGR